jgi:hypothetical protein
MKFRHSPTRTRAITISLAMRDAAAEDADERARAMHPLAIVAACDHHARAMRMTINEEDDDDAQRPRQRPIAIGALYGASTPASTSCETCVESPMNDDGTGFDFEALKRRGELASRTAREGAGVVGWYRVARASEEATPNGSGFDDAAAHEAFVREMMGGATGSSSPAAFVVVNADANDANDADDVEDDASLEVRWYEWNANVGGFERKDFVVDAPDAERIAIEEVANIVPEDVDSHSARYGRGLESAEAAARALRDALGASAAYVGAVRRGETVADRLVLREIEGVLASLESGASEEARGRIADEREDTLILNYLASATKTTSALDALAEKAHASNEATRLGGGSARRGAPTVSDDIPF